MFPSEIGVVATSVVRTSVGDPLYSKVELLVRSRGATNGQTTFVDDSASALSLTAEGTAGYGNAQSKWGNATSMVFDGGTTTGVAIPQTTDLEFASRTIEFCIEAWIYCTDLSHANTIISSRDSSAAEEYLFKISTAGALQFDMWGAAAANVLSAEATSAITINTWYHVAVVRRNIDGDGEARIYLDGTDVTTTVGAQTADGAVNTVGTWIGHNEADTAAAFEGYIDSLRITSGDIRYAADFTPLTQEFGAYVAPEVSDPLIDAVKLLVRSRFPTNTQTTFTDESQTGRTLTGNGQVTWSNNRALWGNATSMAFDGSGNDWVRMDATNDFNFSVRTTRFCVEAWVYVTNFATDNTIICGRDGGGAEEWVLRTGQSTPGAVTFAIMGAGATIFALSDLNSLRLNVWHHVAISREPNGSDGTVRMFIDGKLKKTGTQTANGTTNSGGYFIGHNEYRSYRDFTGSIDSVRITVGETRYTAGFTRPIREFPDFGDTTSI